ncbi:MAG: DUF7901 domain-containing protein, partial [Planctomycetota bacterium]
MSPSRSETHRLSMYRGNISISRIAAYDHGDKIVVAAGTYGGGYDFMGKAITIASLKPEDPCVVAATIIYCGSPGGPAFYFRSGEGRDSVVEGFTLQGSGDPGPGDPWGDADDGVGIDGPNTFGGAIQCRAGSSPTLSHLVIRDVVARGGRGQDGAFIFDPHDPPDDPPDQLDPVDPLPDPCAPEPPELVRITKWSQTPILYNEMLPDYYLGWPVESEEFPPDSIMLADDFVCDSNLPITDIRWWGSLRGYIGGRDEVPSGFPERFRIIIWSNEPNDSSFPNGRPDQIEHDITIDNYTISWYGWEMDRRDPNWEEPGAPRPSKFQFDLTLDPNNYWYQPDNNGVYWLGLQALYDAPPTDQQWGWETRDLEPNTAGAVRISLLDSTFEAVDTNGVPPLMDFAFELIYAEPNLPIDGNDGQNGLPGIPGIPGPNGIPGANGFDGGLGGDAYGGAMYFDFNSTPLITNVTIINSQALGGYAGYGGQAQDGQDGGNGQIG